MHIVVDGILTNYQVVGNAKKTILILHGWGRSMQEWIPIANTFSSKYTVILLDLPGFGNTPRPKTTYEITDYATFVTHFLQKLAIKQVTLIGHSFGGRIGIILGSQHKLLNKLILVDCAAIETKSTFLKMKIGINKVAAFPLKILFPKKLDKLKMKFGSDDYQNSGQLRDIFIKTVNADLTPYLKLIAVPTILIWGEIDKIRPLSEAKFISHKIPDVILRIVWGAGHSPHIEKPKSFIEILEEYL